MPENLIHQGVVFVVCVQRRTHLSVFVRSIMTSFISEADYDNPALPNYVHPSSRSVAEKIVQNWIDGKRMVVLKAQMQCGKTSVIRHVCYLLNVKGRHMDLKLPDYDRVYVLNNLVDNALREQTVDRLQGVVVMPSYNVNHSGGAPYDISGKGKYLSKLQENRVLISDESHWGTEKDGRVDTIMDYINNPLSGDLPIMEKSNVYLLLVSATPFAEIGLYTTADKVVVTLEPSDGEYLCVL
jgi:hypothetical protein